MALPAARPRHAASPAPGRWCRTQDRVAAWWRDGSKAPTAPPRPESQAAEAPHFLDQRVAKRRLQDHESRIVLGEDVVGVVGRLVGDLLVLRPGGVELG